MINATSMILFSDDTVLGCDITEQEDSILRCLHLESSSDSDEEQDLCSENSKNSNASVGPFEESDSEISQDESYPSSLRNGFILDYEHKTVNETLLGENEVTRYN